MFRDFFARRPRIPYFKESVPLPICMGLSFFFALVFQFNAGVFLPVATQMSSMWGWLKEDVQMAAYASFIGMTLIFPILFRLKFRFPTRKILLTVCPILIACNLISMQTRNVYLLVAVCFVSGIFRMWGTFECFSNVRLSVSPSGNFSIFYPVIYIIVLESIQLSGLVAVHISDWANWQYMHWFVIGMLCVVWFLVFTLTRTIRLFRKVPLYGIDWLVGAIWAIFLFSVIFLCIYGEYYDWLDSPLIRTSIVVAVVALLININRMFRLSRPYISPQVFRYPHFPTVLFLFLMLCFFLTTSNVLQEMFMRSILKYDSLNAVSINWCVFAGIICGSATVFYRQAIMGEGYKLLIYLGFLLLVVYQYCLYFLIHPNLNIESLYLPNFLRGIGYGILYVCLTIYVAKSVPFQYFFQGLCVLSFIRTSIAIPLGNSILGRWMRYLQQDNLGLLSRNLDNVRDWAPQVPLKQLYSEVSMQATLLSLKELYGWICIVGTLFLLCLFAYRIWIKSWRVSHHVLRKVTSQYPEQWLS